MSDSTTALQVSKHFTASPQDVFEAWTSVESVRQWMAPGPHSVPEAEMDVRVGGRFRIVMGGDGQRFVHEGEYREIDPPNKLVFTWISDGTEGRESVVTVELRAADGGTDLTLTHEGLPTETSRSNHEGGWISILEKLDGVL